MTDQPKGEHAYARNEFWYAIAFDTAGSGDDTKVIVHEVALRTRTMQRNETAHFLPEGPSVTRLFKFMLSNLGVLRLKAAMLGHKGGKK